MTSKTQVRIALPADMEAMLDLCVVAYAECGFVGELSIDKCRRSFQRCLDRQGGVAGVLDGEGGQLAGCCIMEWTQPWHSEDWHWYDLLTYVRQEARAGGHAWDALVTWAKWFTDAISPPNEGPPMPLVMGIFQPPGHVEALCRLYRGRFVQIGGTFIYGNTAGGRMEVRHG